MRRGIKPSPTPESPRPADIATFKAARKEAQDAAAAAKIAAAANQGDLDSPEPNLDTDAANKKAGDDLTITKAVLNNIRNIGEVR